MVIVMNTKADLAEIETVNTLLEDMGFKPQLIHGINRIVIGAVGDRQLLDMEKLAHIPGVEKVIPIMKPYKLASKESREKRTVVKVREVEFGGSAPVAVIAGPCAVESEEQILVSAQYVKAAGAKVLRGGAFKPRTSPYSFQGLELTGLEYLQAASKATGLPVITEAIDEASLDLSAQYVDIIQIGARNMQNFRLLQAAGKSGKPVLLKRGMSATIEEWLMAAEYIMSQGNEQLILCERGIRTFETATRNTLDLSAVPMIKRLSHLPILVDPSHGTGDRQLVSPMSLAAIAAGADGLIIETHPDPASALSDGPQSLTPLEFEQLLRQINRLLPAVAEA